MSSLMYSVRFGRTWSRRPDTVIVPPLAEVPIELPQPLLDALRFAHTDGARIVGVGSGTYVLAAAGLLGGTHDRPLTFAGGAEMVDACLDLVRRDHGDLVAERLAQRLAPPSAREAEEHGLAAVMEWAVARLDQPITLADLGAAARVSPRTLTRRFHAELGTSPMRWLSRERRRLARAA